MRRREWPLLLVAALTMTGGHADAQFAAPRKPRQGTVTPAPLSPLAERQRKWAVEATRTAVARINLLPRTSYVPQDVQQAITRYAPTGPAAGYGQAWTADDCESSIRGAETKYGLPPYLLAAIAITESGYRERPHPFAMNISGRQYFASGTAEMDRIVAANGGDQASIDVGCLQINLRWHASRFRDWHSLLVPRYNAEYAALYLTELKRSMGSWSAAVGAYHSRTPWRSTSYACLVSRRWSQIFGSAREGCGADIEAMSQLMYATQRR